MNKVADWKEEDVQRLIDDKIEEDLRLEYKCSRAFSKTDAQKKEEISIVVSAFANSQGGLILYGVQEDGRNHLPQSIDGIAPVEFRKEWLEEIINIDIIRQTYKDKYPLKTYQS